MKDIINEVESLGYYVIKEVDENEGTSNALKALDKIETALGHEWGSNPYRKECELIKEVLLKTMFFDI